MRSSSREIRLREERRPGFAFSVRDTAADFVTAYPELAPVCEALELPADIKLADACRDPAAVLRELARAARPPVWLRAAPAATIAELVAELAGHQHRMIRQELARLESLITWLAEARHRADLRDLRCGWELFRDRLLDHLDDEERECFPLCLNLVGAVPSPARSDCAGRLARMGDTHHVAMEEIDDMRSLAHRVDRAIIDPDLRVVVAGLDALAASLAIHTELEGGVLLPWCIRLVFGSSDPDHAGSGNSCRNASQEPQ